ncbi:MAG: ETC complex I subunit [Alphaproteobacteria bacterium]
MKLHIYAPARTATQSGKAQTGHWVAEFVPERPRSQDPLMGWTSSADTTQQVRLRFPSREEAIAFAEREGYAYVADEVKRPTPRLKSYADNFR